jgi:ATP-dependent Clp protease ATP-binding subunit ClpA
MVKSKSLKHVLFKFGTLSFFLFATFPVLGAGNTKATPLNINCATMMATLGKSDQEDYKELLQEVQIFREKVKETLPPNSFNVRLSTIESPEQIISIVKSIQDTLKTAPAHFHFRPDIAREAVLKALELLYSGRGNTVPKDQKGWYPASRNSATGIKEIKWILSQGVLDQEGLDQFKSFVESHDYNSPLIKRNSGFPPQFEINRDDIKKDILTSISGAPAGQPFHSSHTTDVEADVKIATEILDDFRKSGGEAASAKLFFSPERFVKGDFPDYYGREEEINQIVDVLTRGQKQHFLLVGKAGVGKTTIIKMLQYEFLKGQKRIWDEKPPIFIEVPITALTNPTDPSAIRNFLDAAVRISTAKDRRIILFADEAHVATNMAQNAMKAFLTEVIENIPQTAKVNVALATTSGESRKFDDDSAFQRRFAVVQVPEFSREQVIGMIQKTNIPKWIRDHKKASYSFNGNITPEAYDYAYRYRYQEQRSGETGTAELLEGAIVAKLNRDTDSVRTSKPKQGSFSIDVEDIQKYLRDKFRMDLIPGAHDFEANFKKKWDAFEVDYTGQEGAKALIKQKLRSHFGQLVHDNVSAIVAFGPPGAGKSYGAEKIAEHFFNNAVVTLNGAEYKNGGLELNKLIGSPPGTVGSEDRRSILTKALKENPNGFILKIEEADYLHRDVIQFLTNFISNKKFTDGLGHEWDTSNVFIWMNSNIGQDEMIPTDSRNKMDWTQYNIRKSSLTESQVIEGKAVEVARPERVEKIFDQFIETVVTKSGPSEDGNEIAQEANKQKRRYTPIYILPPDKAELVQAAENRVRQQIETIKREYGITLVIPQDVIEKAIDLDHYDFEKGYSYVVNQLATKVFDHLTPFLHMRGTTITAQIDDSKVTVNLREVPSQNLKILVNGKVERVASLGAVDKSENNPWGSSPEMMKRIQNFPREMRNYIKGNGAIIQGMNRALKDKAFNWNRQVVFTLLGTSGNGKTEMAKALAKVLFGSESAMFKITGVDHPWDLSDYFRPPKGVQGGKEKTDFEDWFKSRKTAGGGVILFDELLSELGSKGSYTVDNRQGGKIAVLRELYELLDEGKLKIGGKIYDAKGFVILITGNTLQELFNGIDDTPEAEQLVQKINQKLKPDVVNEQLGRYGLDAPIIARLGQVHVLGPQPRSVSINVGEMKTQKAIKEIQGLVPHPIEISLDPKAVEEVVARLSTVRLGMRAVDRGFEKFMFMPLRGIIQDLDTPSRPLKKIEMKLVSGSPVWSVTYADSKTSQEVATEVALEAFSLGDNLYDENWKLKTQFDPTSENHTPQLKDLETVEKMKVTPEMAKDITIHEVYGHWMVDAILNHRNGADFISIIPGQNYFGYVRPKEIEVHDGSSLMTVLKEVVVLESGHRAVFKFGRFKTGAGNGGEVRDKDKPSNDDLGKVYAQIDMIINNNLIPDTSEHSDPKKKAQVKQYIDKVSALVADRVIERGLRSRQFQPVFDRVLTQKYAGHEELENYLKQVDFSKVGDSDVLFCLYFTHAVLKTINSYPNLKESVSGIIDRVLLEAMTKNSGNDVVIRQLTRIQEAFKSNIAGQK